MTIAGPVGRWGPRPFRFGRDLGDVLDLMELAFGEEAVRFRDLRFLAGLGPLLSPFEPILQGIWPGIVWEEDGRVVGNVNFARLPYLPRVWLIFNVAVHPDYRRRGIARRLMTLALDRIRLAGGQVAVLDVETDNLPARNLYLGLGFELLERLIEYRGRVPELLPIRSPNIRPWGLHHWVTRRGLPGLDPPNLRRLRLMEWQVGSFLGRLRPADLLLYGRRIRSWVCEVDGRLLGFGRLDRPLFGQLRLGVWLAPEMPEMLGLDFLSAVVGKAKAGLAATLQVAADPDRFELPPQWEFEARRRLDRMFKWV
ncbi:MAG: hypothetical protein C4316_09030 [Chloroflexota bacterium]